MGLILLLSRHANFACLHKSKGVPHRGNKAGLRTVHAYVGSTALCILLVHAALGLKLGMSL